MGDDGVLYVALANAGQVEDYNRPPLILTFKLPASNTFSPEKAYSCTYLYKKMEEVSGCCAPVENALLDQKLGGIE